MELVTINSISHHFVTASLAGLASLISGWRA